MRNVSFSSFRLCKSICTPLFASFNAYPVCCRFYGLGYPLAQTQSSTYFLSIEGLQEKSSRAVEGRSNCRYSEDVSLFSMGRIEGSCKSNTGFNGSTRLDLPVAVSCGEIVEVQLIL